MAALEESERVPRLRGYEGAGVAALGDEGIADWLPGLLGCFLGGGVRGNWGWVGFWMIDDVEWI